MAASSIAASATTTASASNPAAHVVRDDWLKVTSSCSSAVSRGARNWFGAAAMRPDGSFRRADVVLRGYYGQGRHLFLDVAVADPAGQAPMEATPSSCASCGVAAELRALRKVQRYAPLAAAVSSAFRPAVVERFGAFSDALVGVVREVCGDRDRDRIGDCPSRRMTYISMSSTTSCRCVHSPSRLPERQLLGWKPYESWCSPQPRHTGVDPPASSRGMSSGSATPSRARSASW